ncbi:MAG: aminotransferase class IV [Prolixibacteraceae bacterium]|nr:aminotransferase class IV [Prolixibacteraceae bacterium]
MSSGKYTLVNGTFIPTEEYRISREESDAILFTERIRAVRTAFPFFSETLERIKLELLVFNQSFAEFTDLDGKGLKRQLERTLTKNKQFMGAILTIQFRLLNQKIQYTIQSEKLDTADYELNEKGLYIDIFDQVQKPAASLSNLSLGSAVYWSIVRNYLYGAPVDQLLLVNTEDLVIEAPQSNIYLITGDRIRGASCEQGAYLDISQLLLLELFSKLNLNYSENEGITIEDLRKADEIMIVNAIEGIRWVVGFEGKRYFNNTIRKISDSFTKGFIS